MHLRGKKLNFFERRMFWLHFYLERRLWGGNSLHDEIGKEVIYRRLAAEQKDPDSDPLLSTYPDRDSVREEWGLETTRSMAGAMLRLAGKI